MRSNPAPRRMSASIGIFGNHLSSLFNLIAFWSHGFFPLYSVWDAFLARRLCATPDCGTLPNDPPDHKESPMHERAGLPFLPEVSPARWEPIRSLPISGVTLQRDVKSANCPKVEMYGPKMLQDSDRSWRMASGPSGLSNRRKAGLAKGKSVGNCRQKGPLQE